MGSGRRGGARPLERLALSHHLDHLAVDRGLLCCQALGRDGVRINTVSPGMTDTDKIGRAAGRRAAWRRRWLSGVEKNLGLTGVSGGTLSSDSVPEHGSPCAQVAGCSGVCTV